jgi:hypothetical protein
MDGNNKTQMDLLNEFLIIDKRNNKIIKKEF